jgi:hypothetical protein
MNNIATAIRLLVVLAALVLVAGCSGLRPYPNTLEKNVFVDVKADRGVKVSMNVYKVEDNCDVSYEGTVRMKGERTGVGIPTGRRSFLAVNFGRSSFLMGKSSISHGALLTPRSGKVYKMKAVYTKGMYNVEIREARSADDKGRELEFKLLEDCKPLK